MTDDLAADPWKGCNPLDSSFRNDPHPALKRLRETDPVSETPLGIWRLCRHADVERMLRDVACGVRTSGGVLPGVEESIEGPRRFMLQQDPPNHTRLRKLVSHAFTPRSLAAWREEIQAVVDGCLDRVAPRGEMDVIRDLALPVPATIICQMIGVPPADRDRFTVWTSQVTLGLAAAILPRELAKQTAAAGSALAAYIGGLVARRRRDLRDDLLSTLIRAEEDGDRLSAEELFSQAIGLLMAGFETTIGLIGNGVRALIRHPSELAKLRERPDLLPKAVQECLRYDGPIVFTARVLHEDVEFGGRRIGRDSTVWAMLPAANRDPEKFPDPDRLDIERDASDHVGFGGGPHFCLGYRLAEIEAQAAIGALVRRFSDLRLVSDTVEWGPSLFHVPATLPVTFQAG